MHRRTPLAALVLISTLLTGCVQSLDAFVYEPEPPVARPPEGIGQNGLSLRIKDVEMEHLRYDIPTRDGLFLAADVWRPEGMEGIPVVLILSPYFESSKDAANENFPRPPYSQYVGNFVPRGYAVALVDLRGTRWSEGCMDLGGPNELADAHDVVEFLGTLNWTNGKVGMMGHSYDGWTALMAAVTNPPHLAAIIPSAPVTDLYHGLGKGGAKYEGWVPMTQYTYNYNIGLGMPMPGSPPDAFVAWAQTVTDPASPQFQRLDDQDCAVENTLQANDPTGDYNAYLKTRDLRPLAESATAPMFYTHGFADVNAKPDHFDPWYNAYGGPKTAWFYQDDHASNFLVADTGRQDWWPQAIQWFDYHLKGLQNNVTRFYGVAQVQDNFGRWRNETSYPPADAMQTAFLLSPGAIDVGNATPANGTASAVLDRLLLAPAEAAPASESYRDNPMENGGAYYGYKTTRASVTPTDARLSFESAPLEGDLHYAGRPVVRVFAETDKPNAYVVVRLYEILPDGSWVLLNRGVQSFRHRDGLDNPQPAVPKEVVEIHAAMQPMDHVFQKGHRIGLTITGADSAYILPSGTLATTTIHYGAETPSALVLPLVERDAFFLESWGSSQPGWLGPMTREVSS